MRDRMIKVIIMIPMCNNVNTLYLILKDGFERMLRKKIDYHII